MDGSGDAEESERLRECMTLLNRLKRNSNAGPFLYPVDPVALNIPDYFEKIKHPMDISTVREKLAGGKYASVREFDADIQLMFQNCATYNAPGTPVHEMGKKLKSVYEALFSQVGSNVRNAAHHEVVKFGGRKCGVSQRLTTDEVGVCADIINNLLKIKYRKYNWPFLAPVTEEEAPGYFSIISNPMDLGTARTKLDTGAYKSVSEFINDILLIFRNCRTYNSEGTEVYRCGEELEKIARGLIRKHFEDEQQIADLKENLETVHNELTNLEIEARSSGREVFGIVLRESLAEQLAGMSRNEVCQVAEIFHKHGAYDYTDGKEIEINLYTASDNVLQEVYEWIKLNTSVSLE